jgi:flagellar hook-associated protein 3 FlgL
MRISTSQLHNAALNSILDQQSSLLSLQQQIATGRRILTPSDDPSGSARALNLTQVDSVFQQYNKNANLANARLRIEENTLTGVTNLIQTVRELAIQANNDTQSNESRRAISLEVRQRLNELVDLANTRDANGEYIFAGFQGFTQPVTVNANSTFAYAGDNGQRFVQIGPNRQVATGDSGLDAFFRIRNGNGTFATAANVANSGTGVIGSGSVSNPAAYTVDTFTIDFVTNGAGDLAYTVTGATAGQVVPAPPAVIPAAAPAFTDGQSIVFNGVEVSIDGAPAVGDSFTVSPSVNQDIFTTIQNLVTTLEAPVVTSAGRTSLHNDINSFLSDLDQGLGRNLDIRAGVGARLNSIDDQLNINEATSLQLKTSISEIQDLDYAEAISELEQTRVSLDAAQRSFLRIQGLSLFNYL